MSAIYAFLRDPLNSDSRDMAVNGATTPVAFRYTAPAAGANLERVLVYYQDTGAFDAAKYANNITLTNGIEVQVHASDGTTVKTDLLDGETIKTNGDWSSVCFDVNHLTMGTGDETLAVRWTFSKAGQPIRLAAGDSLAFTINDDMTGMTIMTAMVQGHTA